MILKFNEHDQFSLEADIIDNFDDLNPEFITIIRLKDVTQHRDRWEVVKDLLHRKGISLDISDPEENPAAHLYPQFRADHVGKVLDISKSIIGIGIVYGSVEPFVRIVSPELIRDEKATEKLVTRLESYGFYPIQDSSKWFYNSLGNPRFYFPSDYNRVFLCGEIWLYQDSKLTL